MKDIARQMNIRMGFSMSLFLSVIGNATSGHFSVPGFIISFFASLLISLVIGFVIPVGAVGAFVSRKCGLKKGHLPSRLVESLVSDLIYTPLITLAMVFLAYIMAMKQSHGSAELSLPVMYLHSLPICMITGFVLIFFLTDLFMKSILKDKGLNTEGPYSTDEKGV